MKATLYTLREPDTEIPFAEVYFPEANLSINTYKSVHILDWKKLASQSDGRILYGPAQRYQDAIKSVDVEVRDIVLDTIRELAEEVQFLESALKDWLDKLVIETKDAEQS